MKTINKPIVIQGCFIKYLEMKIIKLIKAKFPINFFECLIKNFLCVIVQLFVKFIIYSKNMYL